MDTKEKWTDYLDWATAFGAPTIAGNVHTYAWDDALVATPLADIRELELHWTPHTVQITGKVWMHPRVFQRIRRAVVLGSVAHLPRRTRARLLARVRAGQGAFAPVRSH